MIELAGPITYRPPNLLTLRAVLGGLLWLLTRDVTQAARRGWIVVIHIPECE